MSQPPVQEDSKRERPWASALAFFIGVAALVAFIVLNRKMAPPFPNFAKTNAPAGAASNTPAQPAK